MANDCDWHRFFFKRWTGDESVKLMTVEQVGAYWLLLINQMENGSIPSDPEDLVGLLRNMDVEHFKAKVWNKVALKFKPVPDKEGRLQNDILAKIVGEDKASLKGKSNGGKIGYAIKSMERAYQEVRGEGTAPETIEDINIQPILKAYPKRNNNVGFTYGEALIKATICTQEDFNAIFAAVKNYARENRTCPRDKIKRLDNFMREWRDWLPKGYSIESTSVQDAPVKTESTVAPADPAAPPPFNAPRDWCVPETCVRSVTPSNPPPWIVPAHDIFARQRAAREFPDNDSKHRWWMTPEVSEQSNNVGA